MHLGITHDNWTHRIICKIIAGFEVCNAMQITSKKIGQLRRYCSFSAIIDLAYLYADVSAIEFDTGANAGRFVKTSVVVEPNMSLQIDIYTFNTKYFSSIRHVRIKHFSKEYFN